MLMQLLGLPEHPLVMFLTLTTGGLLAYGALASLSYLYFFKWRGSKYHPGYRSDGPENRRAVKWSAASVAGNALLMTPIHLLIALGYGKVYWDVDDHGWGWLGISFVLYMVVTETMIYWTHRALHVGPLYRYIHHPHHSFKVTTPWVGVAFNPLDSFAQALPHHLCVFLFPVHGGMYLFMVAFVTLWAVMIHDRVSFVRWGGINYTGHHTLHHWYAHYNYGQFFTFWDRIMGTYLSPESKRVAEEIPEGVVVRG